MLAPVRTADAVLRPIHVVDVLVGLALPAVSLSLVGLRLFPGFQDSIAAVVYSPSVVLSAIIANLGSLVLSLWALRVRRGPVWVQDLLGVGAVMSGTYVATAAVLLGFFATLGG
jgi:hypothetical protein